MHARTRVAKAMRLKSVSLARCGREAESIAVIDALISRFGNASEPELHSVVVEVGSWGMADRTRARQRRRERQSILGVIYIVGIASLITGTITKQPPSALRSVGIAWGLLGLLLLITVQLKTGARVRKMSARRGSAAAMRLDYSWTMIAFVALAVVIVAGELLAWLS